MIKFIGTLAAGVALGVGAVLLVQLALDEPAPAPQHPVTTLRVPVPPGTDSSTSATVSLAQIQAIPEGFERDAALYDLLRGTDANGIEALLDEAAGLDPAFPRWTIYRRYIEIAPRAALNYVLSNETNAQPLIQWGVIAWGRSDLDAAVAFADTLAEPLRTEAARSLLNGIQELSDARKDEIARRFSLESQLSQARAIAEAATNPGAAWQRALSIEAGPSRTDALWRVAQRWFSLDPPAALSALHAVADRSQKARWQRRLLTRWVTSDRDAALQWAVSQPPSAERSSLIAEVAATAAKDSPAEMLAFAETLDTKARRDVAQRVLAVWANSEPRAALAALEEMDDPSLERITRYSLVRTWAESDPMALFEWARPRPASDHRTHAVAAALGKVAETSPTDALAFAEELDAPARTNAIQQVLQQWGRDDSRAAAAWLDGSPHKTPDTVAAVVNTYASLDAEEAFDWLQTQSQAAQRQSTSAIVWHAAEESPEAALAMVERIDDPTTKARSGSQLMSRWARNDPHAAVRAIARLGDDLRPPLYQTALRTWAQHDLEGAIAFVDQVPASARDAAIDGVLQHTLIDGDTQKAEELFNRIVNEEHRANAATTMFIHLSRTDPKRAERYREMSATTIAEDGSITVTIPAGGF